MARRKVDPEEVVAIATSMAASMNPFTDLVSAVRQGLDVSAHVAGRAVSRVLETKLIRQEWGEEMRYAPTQAGNASSDPYWKTSVARWVRVGSPPEEPPAPAVQLDLGL